MDNRISIIMASYLKPYNYSATNRIDKFHRAVDSFLNNDFQNKELIIVSDGCEDTCNIYENKYKRYIEINSSGFQYPIKLIKLEKQPLFSGNVREAGLRLATGNIIAYLDIDDIIESNHLSAINKGFVDNNCDFVYYNDFFKLSNTLSPSERTVMLPHISAATAIGTSNIAHKNLPDISWRGCDGYGHDMTFIKKLYKKYKSYKKINGCRYIVCHTPLGGET